MSGPLDVLGSVISGIGKIFGAAPAPAVVTPPTLPNLAGSAPLSKLLAGLDAAKGFDWSAVEKALNGKFANVQDDLVLVEDVAAAVAMVFPPAIYAEDAAAILLVLTKLA